MGATRSPNDIDERVLNKFQKKIYFKLPDEKTRKKMLEFELNRLNSSSLPTEHFKKLLKETRYFSYDEFRAMIKEAEKSSGNKRPIQFKDLLEAVRSVKPLNTKESIKIYKENSESEESSDDETGS